MLASKGPFTLAKLVHKSLSGNETQLHPQISKKSRLLKVHQLVKNYTWKSKRYQRAKKQSRAGLTALSACLPCQPACLVSLPALSACLPCQPACLVSLPALSACLACFLPATIACSSKQIFAVATNSTNKTEHGRRYMALNSLFFNMMSMITASIAMFTLPHLPWLPLAT